MATFALDGTPKKDVLISKRFEATRPIDRRKHRNARSLDCRSEMHRTRVVARDKDHTFQVPAAARRTFNSPAAFAPRPHRAMSLSPAGLSSGPPKMTGITL
jgi:hypothetical protein